MNQNISMKMKMGNLLWGVGEAAWRLSWWRAQWIHAGKAGIDGAHFWEHMEVKGECCGVGLNRVGSVPKVHKE